MAANTMGITRFCKVYLELKSSLRPTRSLKTKFSMFSKSITELILIMFLLDNLENACLNLKKKNMDRSKNGIEKSP
jgi:hypothetical protein|tara:strand:- start:363 stop:590 length:228 start_codon:yes stop_codon:yes gene_type:complete